MLKRLLIILVISVYGPPSYAREYVNQLIDSLTIVKSNNDKVRLSRKIAGELKNSDWDRTIYYLEYAEELAEKSGSDEVKAKTFMAIADIYYEKDVFDVALDYYQKAYNIYDKLNDEENKHKLENDLAIIYAGLKNKDKALYYFKRFYAYQLEKKDTAKLAKILNNIGTLYIDINPDSSEVYYNKSLELANSLNDKELFAYLNTNLARVAYLQDKPDESYKYFKKAISYANEGLDDEIKSWIYYEAANYFLNTGQSDSAVFYAEKAAGLSGMQKYGFGNLNAMQTLYKAYLAGGDYENASKYFELYDEVRDSLNIEEKAVNVERLKLEQEYKTKNKIRALKEQQKKFYYLVIGLSLLTGILILVIILIRYKNRLSKMRIEKQLIEAKRKELDANLELKNKELIGKAMAEIHRTEIIHEILEDLKYVKTRATKKETREAIDYILKRLEKDTNTNIWNEFEVTFNQVHESFFKRLNEKHPELTSKDRRLCALLILNLTSKEISQITGQSFKSVENARVRLRKKLELTNTKIDLTVYLNSLN